MLGIHTYMLGLLKHTYMLGVLKHAYKLGKHTYTLSILSRCEEVWWNIDLHGRLDPERSEPLMHLCEWNEMLTVYVFCGGAPTLIIIRMETTVRTEPRLLYTVAKPFPHLYFGAALCRRPSFHGVGWSVVDACKSEGMQACEIGIHAVVVAATNSQESCLAVDSLAVG